jgi:hypothetical protein
MHPFAAPRDKFGNEVVVRAQPRDFAEIPA